MSGIDKVLIPRVSAGVVLPTTDKIAAKTLTEFSQPRALIPTNPKAEEGGSISGEKVSRHWVHRSTRG